MSISELRDRARRELTGFAWDQWAQLGVFAPTQRRDAWAIDPEALLLFTFEVGRNDPRLFDEVLDWLLTNEKLVSVQRLRNLCLDEADHDLAEAALTWTARARPRSGFVARNKPERSEAPQPLFRTAAQHVRDPDEAFIAFGLLKPAAEPSRKSRPPDLGAPINFAFRMRQLFGVGSRAEVVRFLITNSEAAGAQVIADSAGFAKRNVNETLAALVASKIVTAFEIGNERRYSLNLVMWGQLLGFEPGTWPTYREWPRLLWALRRLARWLEDPRLDALSKYMLASEARSLMDEIGPGLSFGGVPSPVVPAAQGEQYWEYFRERVDHALSALDSFWA